MYKTENDIMDDVLVPVKASPINGLSGGLYKNTRPTGSLLEDLVIHIIPGVTAKFVKDGAVYLKIFYQDKEVAGTLVEDTLRGSVLEKLLYDLSEDLFSMNEYSFFTNSRELYTEAAPEVNAHYAILKINFKYLN